MKGRIVPHGVGALKNRTNHKTRPKKEEKVEDEEEKEEGKKKKKEKKKTKGKKEKQLRGAKHLLTALTCFLSRKQTHVHTREAIKRKALIPICNCFSISTDIITGPKSGNALSPVSFSSRVSFSLFTLSHSASRCGGHKLYRKQTLSSDYL